MPLLKRFASSILFALSIIAINQGASAAGEEVSVSARLDKTTVHVGEPVNYQVTAQWGRDESLQVYVSSHPELTGFEITGTSTAAKTSRVGDKTAYLKIFSYTLRPLKAGDGRVGPVVLEYGEGEQKQTVSTKEVRVKILPRPKSYAPLIKKVLFGALALVVILAGVRMVVTSLRKKKAARQVREVVEKTIEEIALEKIKEGEHIDDSREYFSLISSTLREYLNKKFQLGALAGTSSEIPAALAEHGATPDYVDRVEHLLVVCDAVKFAGHQPDREKVRQVQDDFITLIKMS